MPDLDDDAARLLQDMQRASALVDEADGPAEYQVRLVALAMIARQLLRSDLARLTDPAWTPTSEQINALPDPIRRYVHDLETRCDPSGDVRALTITRDTVRGLDAEVRRLTDNKRNELPLPETEGPT